MVKINLNKLPESHEACLQLSNDSKDFRFAIRFDGCVHIERYMNGQTFESKNPGSDRDYLHICDLREFIETLEEVERQAINHFGKEWPDC